MITVKVYDRTNTTLKETIKGDLLLWDITFTSNVNWWQWNLTLQLNKSITTTDYTLWDIIKIKRYDDELKTGWDLYMWYVTKIGRKQTTSRQYIELSCLWIASLLTEHSAWFNYDSKPVGQLARELIDSINASYGGNIINYTTSTIPDWASLWTGTISTTNAAEAMNVLSNASWRKRYIDWNGTCYMFTKPVTPTHFLSNQKDVESIDIQEEIQEMVNKVFFWSKYTLSQNTSYSDAPSIALYGSKFLQQEINIYWQTALDNYAIQYVNDRKDPKRQTTLVVNREYPIELLQPWDTVKVRNFEYAFDNIQIEKVQYTQDKVIVYLEQYISFGQQIKALAIW